MAKRKFEKIAAVNSILGRKYSNSTRNFDCINEEASKNSCEGDSKQLEDVKKTEF